MYYMEVRTVFEVWVAVSHRPLIGKRVAGRLGGGARTGADGRLLQTDRLERVHGVQRVAGGGERERHGRPHPRGHGQDLLGSSLRGAAEHNRGAGQFEELHPALGAAAAHPPKWRHHRLQNPLQEARQPRLGHQNHGRQQTTLRALESRKEHAVFN